MMSDARPQSGEHAMTRRIWVAGLLLGFLFPIASPAGELTIPALGVRIPNLPENATPPQVTARLDGLMAVMQVGTATLTIARIADPVPPGSDVTDPAYRAALEAYFGGREGTPPYERATTVGGHDAWTVASARRFGSYDRRINYVSATYTIVDQHTYRIHATAHGVDTMPPDYVTAVRMMANLAFETVDAAAVEKLGAPAGLLQMPSFQPSSGDFYPPTARRLNEQGIAGIEFSINGKGHAQDMRELYATAADLGKGAQALLASTRFKVPPDWAQKGYQSVRFSIEIQYVLVPPGGGFPEQAPPRMQTDQVIVVSGSMLRSSAGR